jgi:hypothetical protein
MHSLEKVYEDVVKFTKAGKKTPDAPYGEDTPYADPGYQEDGKKRYPVDTEAHVRAAWSYVNQDKNAKQYSSGDLAKVKAKIVAAWKKLIDKDGPPSAEKGDAMTRVEFKVAQRQKASRSKRLSDAADSKSDAIDDKDEPTAEDHAAAARAHASATTAAYKVGDTSKADHHSMMARRHARAAKKAGGSKGYTSEFETAQALDAMADAKTLMSEIMDRRDAADAADELCELCGYLDSALEEAINETLVDFTMSPDDKLGDIGEALDEFKDEVLTWAEQAIANEGMRWGGQLNPTPALVGSAKQLAEHMAKAIDANENKTVVVTVKALGEPDAPAGAADQGAETKRDSVELDVPEDFLASVAQLKQLVQK